MKRLAFALLLCSSIAFADDATPESLDRQSISAGIATIKPDVKACGKASTVKGAVKISVKVLPSGDVETADVTSSPDGPLGQCVAAAVRKAKFAKTKSGGSFSYPFMF